MSYIKIKNMSTYSSSLRHYSKQIDKCKPPWNILFFGTDNFSLASLKALNSEYKQNKNINKLEIVTVTKNRMNAVCKLATEEKLKVHSWPLNPTVGYDIGLVVSFGYLIPRNIISTFPLGMLNVHASLLPRWRGAAPIIHAIANGDEKTGITIMTIKPKHFDVGDIVRQEIVPIYKDTTLIDLHEKLANLGGKILIEELEKLPHNLYSAKPQSNTGITLAPKVSSSFGIIDWSIMPAKNIYNLSRALLGLYPLFTKWNELTIKLYDVRLCNGDNLGFVRAGSVHFDKSNQLIKVQCADGNWIGVKSIGVANKRTMSSSDFNNGYLKKVEIDRRVFV